MHERIARVADVCEVSNINVSQLSVWRFPYPAIIPLTCINGRYNPILIHAVKEFHMGTVVT